MITLTFHGPINIPWAQKKVYLYFPAILSIAFILSQPDVYIIKTRVKILFQIHPNNKRLQDYDPR
jgi:hypothetical protein